MESRGFLLIADCIEHVATVLSFVAAGGVGSLKGNAESCFRASWMHISRHGTLRMYRAPKPLNSTLM